MAGSGCLRGERQRPRRPQWGEALGSRSGSRHGSGSVPRRHPAGSQGTTYQLRQPRARRVAVPAQPFIASSRQRSHHAAAPLAPGSAAPLPYLSSPPVPPEPPTRPRAPVTSSTAGAEDFIALRGLRRARGEAPALVWPAEPRPGRGCRLLGAARPSPRLPAAACQRGAARGHHGESLAVTSGDKAPYGDGGRRLAAAGAGLGEVPPVPAPGGLRFSAAPTYQGLHSAVARVGRRGSEAPAVATLGPQRHRKA